MNNELKVYSTVKDSAMALNSWEVFDAFDDIREITNYLYDYTVDGYVITLRQRGTYRIAIVLNLISSLETGIGVRLRLQINGVDQNIIAKGYSENSIIFYDDIAVESETEVVIYAYFFSDDTPTISFDGSDSLMINKLV